MNYLSANQFAGKHGVSDRYVRRLCAEGKLEGAERVGRAYRIPEETELPADRRHLHGKVIAEHLESLFASIDEKKAKLNKLRPLMTAELECLREAFMVEYTYNSNAIEGNILTFKETALVLRGMTIDGKPLKDQMEAAGHRDAFLYMEKLSRRKARLREYEIKSIHSLVLMDKHDDRGMYRHVSVIIASAFTQPVPPSLILVFDGNGRTGRLIMNLELIRNGYPAIDVKFSDRKRYFDAFDSYYRDGNADAMIMLIGEYIGDHLTHDLELYAPMKTKKRI